MPASPTASSPGPPTRTPSPWRSSVAFVLIVWLGGIAVTALPANWNLERQLGLHLLFNWRGPEAPPPRVAIIAIDRDSAAQLGQATRPDTWNRHLHARLIDTLSRLHARSITFDVLFAPRIKSGAPLAAPTNAASCNPALSDPALAEAIEKAGNVTLFMDLETDYRSTKAPTLRLEKAHWPTPCIADAAAAVAPFVLPKIPSRVDQFWPFKPGAGNQPSLPVMSLAIYARDAWPLFCQLLRDTAHRTGDSRPTPCPDSTQNAEALAETFARLRQLFLDTPALLPALREQIAKQPDTQQDSLHALLNILGSPEFPFLHFYGPAETLPTYSYAELLRAKDSTALPDFSDTAVFIGVSERQSTQTDAFQTVFRDMEKGFDIAGVEIAATAFANLRDGKTLRPLPWGYGLLLLLAISAVLVLLFQYASLNKLILAIPAFALLNTALAYYLFTSHDLWISFVVPLLVQLPLALLLAMTWRFLKSREEELKVTTALRQLLPESVVQAIVKGKDLTVEGTTLQGVCLFSDGSQYTSLSETMQPEALRRFLNLYYPALFQPVETHQGFVSDIIGDAMMAIWSDLRPSASSNLAMRENACLAALEIQENVRRFNTAYPERQLPTRIGIHAGEISLGNVGAHGHYEYRAVGDTVNVASRLEGLNKTCGTWIIASHATVQGLEKILHRRAGTFPLKGKKEPMTVHEIMARRENVTDRLRQLKLRFEEALAMFESGDIHAARAGFESLARDYPEDGLTEYYLQRCKEDS